MIYKYKGTKEQLHNYHFKQDGIRGGNMGWAHKVDEKTKHITFANEEYAKEKDNYSKAGGLRMLIVDLINDGLVEEIEE